MGMNTDFAFNMVDKHNRIFDYYFYLNAVFKDLCKKKYLGKSFFMSLNDKLNNITNDKKELSMFIRAHIHYNGNAVPYEVNRIIEQTNHNISKVNRNNIITTLFNSTKGLDMSVIEHLYDVLVNNFYTKNSKFKLFSIFKAKDTNDKNYYMLLGNIKLEKCLDADTNNFNELLNTAKNLKYMQIGDYFVMIRFSSAKNFVREHTSLNYNKNNVKPFPTNIIKVQYFLSDVEIENKFEPVNVDFEYI